MTKELARYDNNYDNLERQALSLPSTTPEAMTDIIRGLYAGRPLLGEGGLLTKLVKDLTQIALQGEMDSHLHEGSLEEGGNRRNGVTSKRMKTSSGSFDMFVPRDRNSSFEPQIIKKRQTVLNDELDNKILALYAGSTHEKSSSPE